MKAYYYDNDESLDYTYDHDSGRAVSVEQLEKLGVIYQYLDTLEEVNEVAKDRDYKNQDTITISPTSFGSPEVLKQKLDNFITEHIHEDEEIRYIIDGEGFFDVRGADDEWIRTKLSKGDLLILPAGIYHRFTLTTETYVKALRLFKDEPKWTPLNRPVDDNEYRKEYLNSINVN